MFCVLFVVCICKSNTRVFFSIAKILSFQNEFSSLLLGISAPCLPGLGAGESHRVQSECTVVLLLSTGVTKPPHM